MKFKLFAILAVIAAAASAEVTPLVVRLDDAPAQDGLEGSHIALWNSHGAYYAEKIDKWTWQRPKLFGTVEDLFPSQFVIDYLTPMLENAGAVVLMPRERDTSRDELIMSQPVLSGKWKDGATATIATEKAQKAARASWYGRIETPGRKAVYVRWPADSLAADDVVYRVNSLAGTREFQVNQSIGEDLWVYLGTFPFAEGVQSKPLVELVAVSDTPGTHASAGAVKVGGGMGDVKRGGRASGYPRWAEGSRYYLEAAGLPDSIWTSPGMGDYKDDYMSRARFVNYLAGGSDRAPWRDGLGIPVDLSFALHTDAGQRDNDSTIVGTLPIVCTALDTLGDGSSRVRSIDMARTIVSEVVGDVRRKWNPAWTQRNLKDARYYEASQPVVPSMILELLSHQNFADMKLGLDPEFQFTVARAIYKGMLKFLAARDHRYYVVQPLPVGDFAITGQNGDYRLAWTPTRDRGESSAMPTYYIVQERVGDGAFQELAVVEEPELSVTAEQGKVYTYRVIAANTGGMSFPSEALSLCYNGKDAQQALIINGFTRVSGPQPVATTDSVGFDYAADMGVPYQRTICYVGDQTYFERGNSGDYGTGASRGDLAGQVFAGNTFDYPAVHGAAMAAARWSFVSSSLEAYLARPNRYPEKTIDLILGKQQGHRYPAFPEELRRALAHYCDNGGNLLVSGSYVGSELYGDSLDLTPGVFATRTLGLAWFTRRAATTGGVKVVKSEYSQFRPADYQFNQRLSADSYTVQAPEALLPGKGCAHIMEYTENGMTAGVAYDDRRHRAVTLGFPFESLTDANGRARLMGEILTFLSPKKAPAAKKEESKKDKKKKKNKKDKKKKKK